MNILQELITKDTNIISLTDENISLKDKYKILGYTSILADYYVDYIYQNNNDVYYFKKDYKNTFSPFSIVEELMGTYLCKYLGLETIKYIVAIAENCYGLASLNFRNEKYEYYFLNDFVGCEGVKNSLYNINVLKDICVDNQNYEELIKKMIDLIIVDIYMIQIDRGNINIQFKIDKMSQYLSFAPIYDFSNCLSKNDGTTKINNVIINSNIKEMLKKSKYFKERLEYILEKNMLEIWQQICVDYKFNQDCSVYERISEYYKNKYKSQKKYIKKIIKDIHL